jgi:hypothetical protein
VDEVLCPDGALALFERQALANRVKNRLAHHRLISQVPHSKQANRHQTGCYQADCTCPALAAAATSNLSRTSTTSKKRSIYTLAIAPVEPRTTKVGFWEQHHQSKLPRHALHAVPPTNASGVYQGSTSRLQNRACT